MTSVLGIDPGKGGAIALLTLDSTRADIVVHDMPLLELTVGGKKRSKLDLQALQSTVEALGMMAEHAVVEDLSGRPSTVIGKGGARIAQKGLWEQGWNCCAPVQALVAARVPHSLVIPSVWKRALKVPADKAGAKLAADRLYPQHAHLWRRVRDDGRAEAVLLAHYYLERLRND